jgi:hypothetical protein
MEYGYGTHVTIAKRGNRSAAEIALVKSVSSGRSVARTKSLPYRKGFQAWEMIYMSRRKVKTYYT